MVACWTMDHGRSKPHGLTKHLSKQRGSGAMFSREEVSPHLQAPRPSYVLFGRAITATYMLNLVALSGKTQVVAEKTKTGRLEVQTKHCYIAANYLHDKLERIDHAESCLGSRHLMKGRGIYLRMKI